MPILTLQRRQTEVGRIRIGQQVLGSNGKPRPEKLDKFRITTASRRLIDEIAALYGGTVQEWNGSPAGKQWEVFTAASSMPVIVPPQNFLTQWYEMWSGGGCQRRCDGETEQRTGSPCLCPADLYERGQLAARGKACKATSRLNIMLAEVPSVGVWRLESHGNNAAIELPGVAEVLAQAGGYVEGVLELQQRKQIVQKPGGGSETRQFIVPYLDVHQAPREVVALSAGPGAQRAAVASTEQRQAIAAAPVDEPVDWAARIAAIGSEVEGKQVWAELTQSGQLTPDLSAAMKARAAQLRAAAEENAPAPQQDLDEPVDAEIVDEQVGPAAVWQQIVAVAGTRGWSTSQTKKAVKDAIGVDMVDATGGQLAAFLRQLQNGGGQ